MKPRLDESELESDWLLRSAQGDRGAFDALYARYRSRIVAYLFLYCNNADDANDLAQETFLRAWGAISRGRKVEAFSAYLYTIARNVRITWAERNRCTVQVPLPDGLPVPTNGKSPISRAEIILLWEFLGNQLDEVLESDESTDHRKKHNSLRKLAFIWFYVDGLPIPELHAELKSLAEIAGMAAPTASQLNNWLSRGDILIRLVGHLIREHSAWIMGLIQESIGQLTLPKQDTDIARLRWRDGLAVEEIASQTGVSLKDLSLTIERLTRLLTQHIAGVLKSELHELRKRS